MTVLKDEDIRVELCSIGWKAQQCIRTTRPKVVILDVEMPEINGIQLFYLVRADPQTRDIPVIFLTAHPHKVYDELPNYEEMNAVVMQKPFEIDALLQQVTIALAA